MHFWVALFPSRLSARHPVVNYLEIKQKVVRRDAVVRRDLAAWRRQDSALTPKGHTGHGHSSLGRNSAVLKLTLVKMCR